MQVCTHACTHVHTHTHILVTMHMYYQSLSVIQTGGEAYGASEGLHHFIDKTIRLFELTDVYLEGQNAILYDNCTVFEHSAEFTGSDALETVDFGYVYNTHSLPCARTYMYRFIIYYNRGTSF